MKFLATLSLVAAACAASAATVLTGDGFVEHPHGVKPKCATSFRIDVDGGVLAPAKKQFFASENGAFLDPLPNADALMRGIRARLPHPKE